MRESPVAAGDLLLRALLLVVVVVVVVLEKLCMCVYICLCVYEKIAKRGGNFVRGWPRELVEEEGEGMGKRTKQARESSSSVVPRTNQAKTERGNGVMYIQRPTHTHALSKWWWWLLLLCVMI